MNIEVEKWEYPTDEEGGDHVLVQTQLCANEKEALAWVAQWLDEGFAVRWYRR